MSTVTAGERPAGAWWCRVRVTEAAEGGHGPRRVLDEHLRVTLPAPPPWLSLADVLLAPGTGHGAADALAAGCPGAAVVAVHLGTARCWVRIGPYGHAPARMVLTELHAALRPWSAWASLAHAWLVTRVPPRSSPAPAEVVLPHGRPAQSPASPRDSSRSRSRTASAGSARWTAEYRSAASR
ncbi:hypothetical protein GCM10010145_03000 [Streptomyces ruber]|uniref:Uncharacterized protein n=2 Tax=Streptomyces TaxID=1883 RepID=A0A918B7I5_9ACTN|nr:hypothetical protein [Streptomyces ruber]GGQ38969.1 hypothetical protein GCM10010145_03000 [Streptomyces ruber]